jgi:uncharacterized membrane protein HdeD (DUF308 family)
VDAPALRQPLVWPLLGASLVVGLAALVRLVDPATPDGGDLTGLIRLPWAVKATIAVLVTLAAVVFFVGVARWLRSRRHEDEELDALGSETVRRRPWLQALAQILSFVNAVVVGYLLWKNVLPLQGLMSRAQRLGPDAAMPPEISASAPWLVTWTFAILALLAAAGALGVAVWFASGDRLSEWWAKEEEDELPPPTLVAAVDESLEDLRDEPDARRAIIRCYARFEDAAAASGLGRMPWQTPLEFMRETLSRLPAPRGAVRTLTALFELARFSDRALGSAERDRALVALDDIKAAIDAAH